MRSFRGPVVALVVGMLAGASALAPAATAHPAASAASPGTVDITVSLDLATGHSSSGPVVFSRHGVTPGTGIELDHGDLSANPSGWVGSIVVDIDPATNRITITPDVPSDFQSAEVTLTGPAFTGVTAVSDSLWINPSADLGPAASASAGPVMARTDLSASAAAGLHVAWHIAPADAAGTIELDPHGSAVLAYTIAPTTTVPCAGTACPATSAPGTTVPGAATTLPRAEPAVPVAAQPTYTG